MAECFESVLLKDSKPDWTSYEANFNDQNNEILALESYYYGTEVLEIIGEASIQNSQIFLLQFKLPVKTNKKSLKAEVWMAYDQLEPLSEESLEAMTSACAISEEAKITSEKKSAKFERSISGKSAHTTIKCDFLPDLNFSVTLPCTYPSDTQPNFTLSCIWLNDSQLSEVCQELDRMWRENDNMPVVFTWAEWLSSELIEFLDVFVDPNTVIITPFSLEKFQSQRDVSIDRRALSLFIDVDDLIFQFLRHSYLEERKAFNKSLQECMICFDEKLGKDFFRLDECRHQFCTECMTDMCRLHVKDGTIQLLKCPASGCKENVSFRIMQECLSDDEFERLERLMLQRTLDTMEDIMYCPQCSQPIIVEQVDTHAMCLYCKIDHCKLCKEKWHSGVCENSEEKIKAKTLALKLTPTELLALTDDQIRARFSDSTFVFRLKKKAADIIMDEEFMALSKFVKCPKCKAPIDKFVGCNKVTCICGGTMCWLCRKAIKGYDHFNDSDCDLWSKENGIIDRVAPRPRHEAHQLIDRVLAVAPDQKRNLISCPTCHQRILKVANNNHLKCAFCLNNICFCCKKRIVGTVTKHFLGTNCKQHGD